MQSRFSVTFFNGVLDNLKVLVLICGCQVKESRPLLFPLCDEICCFIVKKRCKHM